MGAFNTLAKLLYIFEQSGFIMRLFSPIYD